MKKLNRKEMYLTITSSLLIAAVFAGGAAAAGDPLRGIWYSTDVPDGSSQSLIVGGGPGDTYHVRFVDDGATVCNPDLSVAASATGFLTGVGYVLSGELPVYCLASPPTFTVTPVSFW